MASNVVPGVVFAEWPEGPKIPLVQTLPPYAVVPPEFRFRALAQQAGRLPLGGHRELALVTLLAARLASATGTRSDVTVTARRARATAAKAWAGSMTLAAAARAPLTRVFDACAADDREGVAAAFAELLAAVSPSLDGASRNELRRLAATLASPNR
jgi:hypothetical protein